MRDKHLTASKSKILSLVSRYEDYRSKTLNLIPSENILSEDVLWALSSTLSGRYAGMPESYGGSAIFHDIWGKVEKLTRDVFHSKAASVSPISGHIAGMMALDSLCRKGEKIASLSAEDGGYKGYTEGHIPEVLGLEFLKLPFRRGSVYNINLDEAIPLLKREKPSCVILGATVFLFPHPVREISEEVHSYGGHVIYDGSHVMGLVAGREFQDPLREGADILLGSTHKTLFGPQGGIIVSNQEELVSQIEGKFLYRFMDNFHLSRVAALGVALEEVRKHGRTYAKKVIENSKILGSELRALGQPTAAEGRTESHQVLLSVGDRGNDVRERLEKSAIVVDSRVRLGTDEVTRRGMGGEEMRTIAHLVHSSLSETRRTSQTHVRNEARKLASKFRNVYFTLRKAEP